MSASWTRILLVGGALVLFVLLFFAPRIGDKSEQETEKSVQVTTSSDANVEVYLKLAEKTLGSEQSKLVKQFSDAGKSDSLIAFWSARKRPDLAAFVSEKKAQKSKQAADWFAAGNRYYYSVQFTADQSEIPVLFQSAIRSFESGLKLEPSNTDARIMLASSYVEGTQDPMKGVSLLKEMEKNDSNNVKLQLTFGFLSVRSKQMDKAIYRFKKVLVLDSTYLEAYLHLADAYERQGEKENTISMLERYAARTPDPTAKLEVIKYIEQLKESK